MGALAAIAFGCGATDLHMENVIATSEGPIPVDLETLLGADVETGSASAYEAARQFLNESPLGTGVLPLGVQVSGGVNLRSAPSVVASTRPEGGSNNSSTRTRTVFESNSPTA